MAFRKSDFFVFLFFFNKHILWALSQRSMWNKCHGFVQHWHIFVCFVLLLLSLVDNFWTNKCNKRMFIVCPDSEHIYVHSNIPKLSLLRSYCHVNSRSFSSPQYKVRFPLDGSFCPERTKTMHLTTNIMMLLPLVVWVSGLFTICRLTCKWEHFHSGCALKDLFWNNILIGIWILMRMCCARKQTQRLYRVENILYPPCPSKRKF